MSGKVVYTIKGELPLNDAADLQQAGEALTEAEQNLQGYGTAKVEYVVVPEAYAKPTEEG